MKLNTVRGMRDLLPEEAKLKKKIIETCIEVYESFGFEPVESPILEYFETITKKSAGTEIEKEIYVFKDKSNRKLALRFDLTLPLARIVAMYPIAKPFRRYQIGRVYRYDRPQAKRYREFTQADIDIIGSSSVVADYECVAAVNEVLKKLGINAKIRINNRAFLEDVALSLGIKKNRINDAFRIIDKADKFGWQFVEKEFEKEKLSKKFLEIVKNNDLNKAKNIANNQRGIEELEELYQLLKKNSCKNTKIDLTLARGLEYYTGNVFEITTDENISIAGGGRYDNLIGIFSGENVPAVGISIGVDRVLDMLIAKGKKVGSITDVLVAPVAIEAQKLIGIAAKIRKLGLNVELYSEKKGISKILEYANKKRIGFVVLIGENELKVSKLTLKDMESGKQYKIKINELKKIWEIIKKKSTKK
ncbi:MAG: histidine--tRNA ligase [Candidatus Diapherotrites archaeon]|nr:histidine--tRNA ligase [Candidatus Diapherotrites archaeon]